ncbi:MAG: group II intron reverse transcriptase domain-containing protein [Candidatus Eisenbacteria sp.]|nr:group II intron reverse transcriptase domain-containing protein [Candidatus Eisenbacteria bacterium]
MARFLWNLETEILELQEELQEGHYRPRTPRRFLIHDPKERLITVGHFRDRVVHHALCDGIGPILDARAIGSSYACRPGKGPLEAIAHCQRLARRCRFFLKCDVAQFFASIDHAILGILLSRTTKDRRVLALLRVILDAGGNLGEGGRPDRGLPIGSLTSQHLANYYLAGLDHYVLQQLRPVGYLRYMDDFLLFGQERGRLREMLTAIREFLAKRRRLRLRDSATLLAPTASGIPFLGLQIFPGVIRLRRSRIRRFGRLAKRRLAQYGAGVLSEKEWQNSITAMLAHIERGSAPAFRRALIQPILR